MWKQKFSKFSCDLTLLLAIVFLIALIDYDVLIVLICSEGELEKFKERVC